LKKLSATVVLAILLLSGLNIVSHVQAATEIPQQVITDDTTWAVAGSPYTLTGPVIVNESAKLTIEPGVTVNIGAFYLQINGTLEAKGNSSHNIHFSSQGTTHSQIIFAPTSIDWNETESSGCIIGHAQINGAIAIDDASPKIDACQISDNTEADDDVKVVISISNGSAIVTNSQVNGAVEVKDGGAPKISANKITGGISLYAGSPEVSDNDISGGIGDDIVSVAHECSATIKGNNVTGKIIGVGFNMHDNGYVNNSYAVTVSGNTIKDCQTGIGIGEGSGQIMISGNSIFGTTTAIKVANVSANVGIELNLIMNNTYGIDVGAQIGVQRNTIYNNTVGIHYQSAATSSAINYNNIMNNTKYNIELTSSSPSVIDATYNYWGTLNTTFIDQTIYDAKDNETLGEVVFLPGLGSPSVDAPTIPGVDMTPEPLPSPTVTPLPSSSPTPYVTPSQTATPTATPDLENAGLSIVEIAVIVVLVAVVLSAVVLLLRKKGENKQNPQV
jgi:hypothetical protein